jgi:hypothetical protein
MIHISPDVRKINAASRSGMKINTKITFLDNLLKDPIGKAFRIIASTLAWEKPIEISMIG